MLFLITYIFVIASFCFCFLLRFCFVFSWVWLYLNRFPLGLRKYSGSESDLFDKAHIHWNSFGCLAELTCVNCSWGSLYHMSHTWFTAANINWACPSYTIPYMIQDLDTWWDDWSDHRFALFTSHTKHSPILSLFCVYFALLKKTDNIIYTVVNIRRSKMSSFYDNEHYLRF